MSHTFPTQFNTAVETIDSILSYAIHMRASDVHYDPQNYDSFVRLRIDGQVVSVGTVPRKLHEEIIARLKILAGVHSIPFHAAEWTDFLRTRRQ